MTITCTNVLYFKVVSLILLKNKVHKSTIHYCIALILLVGKKTVGFFCVLYVLKIGQHTLGREN